MSETTVHNADQMMDLGAEYAKHANIGDVFGLVGTLGTGKTHWTKGFMKSLNPEIPVSSPTFSIVNEYLLDSFTVFHFDFYRLESDSELLALGWDEYLEDRGIVICEWADLFPDLLPDHTKWLKISHGANRSRRIEEIARPQPRIREESQ